MLCDDGSRGDVRVNRLAVVVVNYGSSALLSGNLVPLGAALPEALIVVVDNYTDDRELEAVRVLARRHNWEFVRSATNRGFGAGMNLGVAHAQRVGASTFLLLNPDLVISAEGVKTLERQVQADPLTLVAPSIARPDGSAWFTGADLYLDDGRMRSSRRRDEYPSARREAWLSGACLMVSGQLWGRITGFSDDYFLYWEDVDLSYRAGAAGATLTVNAQATAVHAEGGTQGVAATQSGAPKSNLYYYYNIRNRMLFAARNLTVGDVRRWQRASVRVAWEVLMQGGRWQLLRSPGPLVAAARGIRDGNRIARSVTGSVR